MKKLAMVGVPLLAFLAAAGGTLAAQGKLGALMGGGHGEAVDGHGEDDGHGDDDDHGDGHGDDDGHGGGHGDDDGHGAHDEALPDVDADGEALRAAFELPQPFEAEELERLTLELEHARDDFRQKARALTAERAALKRLGDDLLAQRSKLEQIMSQLAAERSALDAERIERESKHVRLTAEEVGVLSPIAKTYESMQAQAAAERLAALDIDQAAKILALMKARKAAKVLEATSTAQAAELSKRLAGLRREAAAAEEGR